jgi:hypothetical protein
MKNTNSSSSSIKDVDNHTHSMDILTAVQLARHLQMSVSYVYKNWQKLGGIKMGKSIRFPKWEEVYVNLFRTEQRVEVPLSIQGKKVHQGMVQDQNRSKTGNGRAPKRNQKPQTTDYDSNRHNLY